MNIHQKGEYAVQACLTSSFVPCESGKPSSEFQKFWDTSRYILMDCRNLVRVYFILIIIMITMIMLIMNHKSKAPGGIIRETVFQQTVFE